MAQGLEVRPHTAHERDVHQNLKTPNLYSIVSPRWISGGALLFWASECQWKFCPPSAIFPFNIKWV